MSINTTSTSEHKAAALAAPAKEADRAQDAMEYEKLSTAFPLLPDPAVIAKLANDFFTALPGQPTTPVSPPGAIDFGATRATSPPSGLIPDIPRPGTFV